MVYGNLILALEWHIPNEKKQALLFIFYVSIFLCIYFFLNFSSYLLKYLLLYKCHPVSPLGVYVVGSVLGYGDPFTSWWVRNAASTNGKNSCPAANYFPCLVIIRDDRIRMVKGSVHVQNGSVLQKQLLSFPAIIPAAEGVPPGTHMSPSVRRTRLWGDTGQYAISFLCKKVISQCQSPKSEHITSTISVTY